MPKDRTPESGVPLTTTISRHLRGSSGNIALPLEPGTRRDRRLPERPDVLGSVRAAKKGLTKVREITGRR